jgi:hypothetical protein
MAIARRDAVHGISGPSEDSPAIVLFAFEGNNHTGQKGCCTPSSRDYNARRVPLFVSIESAGGNNRLEAGLSYICIFLSIDDAFRCDDLSRAIYMDMLSHPMCVISRSAVSESRSTESAKRRDLVI